MSDNYYGYVIFLTENFHPQHPFNIHVTGL